jgi:anthranilate phosphoribosyltransferase
VLRNEEHGAHRDALVIGAALVAEVTGAVRDPVSGAALAANAIDNGSAARLLDDVIAWGQEKSA